MPVKECIACSKLLPDDGRFLTCVECSFPYHMGTPCSGVAESTFQVMGTKKKEKWRCRSCRAKDGRESSAPDKVSSQLDIANLSAQFAEVNEKLDQLLSLKDKVDSLLGLPAQVNDLLTLKTTFEEMKATVNELKTSVEFNSGQYDQLLVEMTTSKKEINDLKAEMTQLKNVVSENAACISHLQVELNDAEQYNRLPNLEIHGMPVSTNEDLKKSVFDLADKLSIPSFQPSDVVAVHRLPSKKDKIPPILVRFSSSAAREIWMKARSGLRELAQARTLPQLYFNENLTQINRNLFWKARTRGKEKRFKYVWVRNGKIFAKRQDEATPVRISCEHDLELIN
ncbi:unnamed protein product [Ixodes pacificus]